VTPRAAWLHLSHFSYGAGLAFFMVSVVENRFVWWAATRIALFTGFAFQALGHGFR